MSPTKSKPVKEYVFMAKVMKQLKTSVSAVGKEVSKLGATLDKVDDAIYKVDDVVSSIEAAIADLQDNIYLASERKAPTSDSEVSDD